MSCNEVLIADDFRDEKMVLEAEEKEVDNGKKFSVFCDVQDSKQSVISTKWVLTTKSQLFSNSNLPNLILWAQWK